MCSKTLWVKFAVSENSGGTRNACLFLWPDTWVTTHDSLMHTFWFQVSAENGWCNGLIAITFVGKFHVDLYLKKKNKKKKQTQLLKLPRLVFSVMVDNLSVGESACLRCEDDDVLPVGMKALRNKAWPWNCHLLFFLLRLLKKKLRSINWEA